MGTYRTDLAILVGVLLGWAALSLALNLPINSSALWGPFHLSLALEAALALGLLALLVQLFGRVPRVVSVIAAAALFVLVLLRGADFVARAVVDRPLNLFLDVAMIPALWDVTVTFLGFWLAVVATGAVALMLACGLAALIWGLSAATRAFHRPLVRYGVLGMVVIALVAFVVPRHLLDRPAGWRLVIAPASLLVYQQNNRVVRTLEERAAFRAALDDDSAIGIASDALLADLRGRDVFIIYIESYGVTALDEVQYADVIVPRLQAMQARADDAGLSVVSGRKVAVSVGGQSWLNHATFSSGLRIDNQLLYSIFLAEQPRSLPLDFAAAGWRTVQIKPAITIPWPEGRRLGYQSTVEANDMGYDGPRFYWGIVPDQFALDFFARTELEQPDRRPVFASIALISSHAPWLPVPEVVDWDLLGDGSIYETWTRDAPAPREIWRDPDLVRIQFAESIAHSIDAVGAFLADRMPEGAVAIVLGDHQPANIITGPDASRAVPVHVFSDDAGLLERFSDIGMVEGILPPPQPEGGDSDLPGMETFRPWLLQAFSAPRD